MTTFEDDEEPEFKTWKRGDWVLFTHGQAESVESGQVIAHTPGTFDPEQKILVSLRGVVIRMLANDVWSDDQWSEPPWAPADDLAYEYFQLTPIERMAVQYVVYSVNTRKATHLPATGDEGKLVDAVMKLPIAQKLDARKDVLVS